MAVAEAGAHDPSAYGGLFRSRNLGASWLNADVGLFLNAAITLAVDPRDPAHLLLGTDIGLLGSRSGGRSWAPEAPGIIVGAVFAVAFAPGGESAICAAPSGIFRFDEGGWTRVEAPEEATPSRVIAYGGASGRIYLLGRRRLFASEDGGRSFGRVPDTWPDEAVIASLAVLAGSTESLAAVVDGKLMTSADGGRGWTMRAVGRGDTPVEIVVADPLVPHRLRAAASGRFYVSEDRGLTWREAGETLPERGTIVRGIVGDASGATFVVTTHRGMYRSTDGGANWELKEGNLPAHLESGPLLRDPGDPATLYAVYSLMPYAEVWRRALEGGNLLSRIDPVSLAGGLAFLVLLILSGALLARRLARYRAAAPNPPSPLG